MAFEIQERDLLARIGRLETKSGVVETPILLPVVNPKVQPISPKAMQKEFGCSALMTNAYIIKKHSASRAVKIGIHSLLDFNGVVMTDSGAYQILVYGDVATTNSEIIRFQEQINTDIATILDVPTGWGVSQQYAKDTVQETLKRAGELIRIRSRDDVLWIGPVQGGVHLDLVAKSAKAMSKLHFQVHALGSPTPVMEQYFFDTLVDMIMAAKANLPPDRALHLFGAGHPFMFSLAVALGCDLFDSAAYALFARQDRYMTETGTVRLNRLKYFPCSCPVCNKYAPADVKEMPKPERQEFLARHNLQVSLTEVKRIKQAIVEGRMWEHLEIRSHGHPAMLRALRRFGKYADYLEAHSPVSKKSGLFFYSSADLTRPEVVRYSQRLLERYIAPKHSRILLLLPQTRTKPFHKSREHSRVYKEIERKLGNKKDLIHVCTYAAPFGMIPLEIDEVYPLSQHEVSSPNDFETIMHVGKQMQRYIEAAHYNRVILLQDDQNWDNKIVTRCRRVCEEKRVQLTVARSMTPWNKPTVNDLITLIQQAIGEKA
jgi:7-cyano-7-deazaguanine tRNA-ribosyltransferase